MTLARMLSIRQGLSKPQTLVEICFIVLVADDVPKLYVVSKHGNVPVQPTDAVISIYEEEDGAKNGALMCSSRDRHLRRPQATKTDNLRSTKQEVVDPLQKLASYPYAAEPA
ncbi:hypothetical protein SprV_0200970100 [Sparganum proliferum]